MKEICAKNGQMIVLGRQGEHLARCVVFDIGDWQTDYGQGTVLLLMQRGQEEAPYLCDVTVSGSLVRWEVRAADVGVPGRGRVELQYRVGEAVVKSRIYTTLTVESLGQAGDVPPAPEPDWVNKVLQAAADAEESAEKAKAAIGQAVVPGENGNWWVNGEDTGVKAAGPAGKSGLPAVVYLSGAVQTLALANNTDYRCADAVTSLTLTGFAEDPDGNGSLWSIQFAAGATIQVTLPDTVVWNCGASPAFTPGSEYSLVFTPLLSGRVLGVWNEVEA